MGSLLTQHTGGRKMSDETTHDVKERLPASPSKSLLRHSQETNLPYSTCRRAAKRAKLRAYRVSCVQELLPMDHEKRIRFCLWIEDFLTQYPGILEVTLFTDETWFHPSGYVNSPNTRTRAAENPRTVHEELLHIEGQSVQIYTPHNRTTQRRYTPRYSSRQRRHFAKSITEFEETHSSVFVCERRPVSASIVKRSCFASFPVCVYKFSSHYLNNTVFYRQ